MREIEAQAVRLDERPRLLNVISKDSPQSCVQQMRRRMVSSDGPAPGQVDREKDPLPGPQNTGFYDDSVGHQLVEWVKDVGHIPRA